MPSTTGSYHNIVHHPTNEHYELLLPKAEQTGVLILFGGFPENPDVIKREFEIVARRWKRA